ncbi:MAG TPA: hypothetical protein VFL76_10430 [Edaphocola sp.]|nr:hypothetical protein [Edaphocola sp.]
MKQMNKYLLLLAVAVCLGLTVQSCAGRNGQYGCPERIEIPVAVSCLLRP